MGVVKNKYGLLSVASLALTHFNVAIVNIRFSVPQVSNPVKSTVTSRRNFGPLFHHGPQQAAASRAIMENVSQMFSGASSADAYFWISISAEVMVSVSEQGSHDTWKMRWPAATKGSSKAPTKSIEMLSLRREDLLNVQLMRTAHSVRSHTPTVPGP